MVPRAFPARKVIRMNGGHRFFAVTLGKKPRPWRSWLESTSFGRADALCAVSRFVGETTRSLLHLGDRPIEILPNPVDVSLFSPRPGVPEEEGLILFVGTVCEKKGVRQLIQAMPGVVARVPRARLIVAGRDSVDPDTGTSYTSGLKGLLPPDLADRVEFLGHVEHAGLPGLIARSQVCIFPSHMESQGIVIVEAMAMGKAVVTSRTGPGPELVDDGISGVLCDPHDPGTIAEAVAAVLGDPGLRRGLGDEARRRAVHDFSTEALVGRNEDFYARCLRRTT
jgi:glycosyltransferase involved in cell wall biosynthesis